MNTSQMFLVYDKQCPLCENYCQMIRIRESVGQITLVDARSAHPVIAEITEAGLDIDQGMVLKMGDMLYYASDVIHVLSLMSSRVGFFNRMNYWLFRSKGLSRIIYPVLRVIRNLLLKVLSKSKINNLNVKSNNHF